jgi:hypothetical protein
MSTSTSKRKWSRVIISGVAVAAAILIGLKLYLICTPVEVLRLIESDTASGRALLSAYDCAHQQNNLLAYIKEYDREVGRPPQSFDELINHDTGAMAFNECPLGPGYEYFPENYGIPDAVLIREHKNKHPNTLYLWLHGLHPRVETWGDGTVRLFKNSDLITLQPDESLAPPKGD